MTREELSEAFLEARDKRAVGAFAMDLYKALKAEGPVPQYIINLLLPAISEGGNAAFQVIKLAEEMNKFSNKEN